MGKEDDSAANNATTDAAKLGADISAFSSKGGAVLFVQYYTGHNDLLDAILGVLGVSKVLDWNYWAGAKLDAATRPASPPIPEVTNLKRAIDSVFDAKTNATGVALAMADYMPCVNSREWPNHMCTDAWLYKNGRALLTLKSMIESLDDGDVDFFASSYTPSYLKVAALLGDKARQLISYPFWVTDIPSFVLNMYADSSIVYRRSTAPRQPDLGSLTCPEWMVTSFDQADGCLINRWDYRTYEGLETVYSNEIFEQPTLIENQWTTTGLYALPGETFNVSRVDNNGSYVKTELYFWYQRIGISKSLEPRGDMLSGYHRPTYTRSHGILIPPGGSTVTITAPYGGPIYLQVTGLLPDDKALDGAYSVKLRFDGVAKHATILDMGSQASVNHFLGVLYKTNLPTMDWKGDGLEVHARKDKLFDGLTKSGDADLLDYTDPVTGIQTLVDDYRFRFVETQYGLAGFKAPGKSLRDTLPQEVQALCSLLKWPCLDEKLHRRQSLQHSNYDDRATCGAGCSGNPWDAAWPVQAIGWGESHELGHNMQIYQLVIGYPSAPNGDRNKWSSLSSTSGENSNNIFPYYVKWNYYRKWRRYEGWMEGPMYGMGTFGPLQTAYAQLKSTSTGKYTMITDFQCAVYASYDTSAPQQTPAQRVFEAFYDGAFTGYGDQNSDRQCLYFYLAQLTARNPVAYGGVRLTSGWTIITLLHQAARQLGRWGNTNDTYWNSTRSLLGMDLFPRMGGAPGVPYSSSESVAGK